MNKKIILLALSIACFQLLSAQKLPSTLLWKITGNGLQKPSYLYGTMHLTDERVFNIGDSVYKAIENSEGFATEIDPEEFTPFVIDEAKKSYMAAVRLKDMMSQGDFKKYGKALAKKLNKNEDDITTTDILHEKNKWIKESYSTGKMQTFLDVYLIDIARRQGKWTGGVEDLQDQENVVDVIDESDIEELAISEDDENSDKAINRTAEIFIRSYIDNDLNAIDSLSYTGDSLYEDALLVKRNKKMAMRMDSMSRVRSMVFAVGAAHLPDDKGLIALLKQRGFTVTPVFSSTKIKAGDYKVAEKQIPWYEVKDEAGFYTDSMPGKSGDLTLYGMLTMKMYFDAFTSTIYMTTALKTPYSQHIADSLFDHMTDYYFKTDYYKGGKPITINNVPGKEFISAKENYSHGYLLFKDGMMYMAIAMTMKKDSSAASSINRFLHAFTILEPINNNNENSFTYTNKIKAYKIEVPAKPRSANDMLAATKDTSIRQDLNVVIDPANGSYFFFGTNEAERNFYITNDSSTLANIKTSQRSKLKNLSIDTMYIKNGQRVMEFGGMMAEAPLMLKAHYEFRGNRWYALVTMYDPAKPHASAETFFNSFTMLNYDTPEWKNYSPENKSFTTWAPSDFTYSVNNSDHTGDTSVNYGTYDSSRGDNYEILQENFNKYYWQNSDSSLWNEILKDSKNYNDSILSEKAISNGEVKGYELEMRQSGSGNIKRMRKLLNGNKLYSLITIQAATEINNDNNNKFFETFRFNAIEPNTNVFTSKASLLLKDISDEDSAVRGNALNDLANSPFTKNDLPLLHQALLKNYAQHNEDDENYDETKDKLKKIIIDLNDTSSYNFAKTNYASADDETKNVLLAIMASFPAQKNFDDIKNILLNQPPHTTPGYDFTDRLTDTLQLTATIFPELLPLLKDTVMSPVIIRIANDLLDNALADKNLLQPYQQNILQLAEKKYKAAKDNPDYYDDLNYSLMTLLGKLNNKECNAMLQQWSLSANHPYLQMNAVEILLQNKQTINPLAVKALAADNTTRTELYDSLKEYKKDNLFPAKYLTQKYFAESYAYSAASDDDDPAALTYLTQKIINFKGRQSRFYFYKISYGNKDDATYSLACAGPFSINITDVSSKDATGDIYTDEDFDSSNLPAQIDALIKQMEDWYTWEDEKQEQ